MTVAPEARCEATMAHDAIMRALDELSYRECEIIKLRYGLGDGDTYTYTLALPL